jgi:hypothetical protein
MRYASTSSCRTESPEPTADASSSRLSPAVKKPCFAQRKFDDLLDEMFRDRPMTAEELACARRALYG